MATTSAEFIPELWSKELMGQLKKELFAHRRPKRSKGAQLLRDAALGHPEYPDPQEKLYREFKKEHMTATEVRMRNEMHTHQLDAYRYLIESTQLRDKTGASGS